MALLERLLNRLLPNGHKVLIFSQVGMEQGRVEFTVQGGSSEWLDKQALAGSKRAALTPADSRRCQCTLRHLVCSSLLNTLSIQRCLPLPYALLLALHVLPTRWRRCWTCCPPTCPF